MTNFGLMKPIEPYFANTIVEPIIEEVSDWYSVATVFNPGERERVDAFYVSSEP